MVLTRKQVAAKQAAAERRLADERNAVRAESSVKEGENTALAKSDDDLQSNANGDMCQQEHAGHSRKENTADLTNAARCATEMSLCNGPEMSRKDVSMPSGGVGNTCGKNDDHHNEKADDIGVQFDVIQQHNRTYTEDECNHSNVNEAEVANSKSTCKPKLPSDSHVKPASTRNSQLSEAEDDSDDNAANPTATSALEITDVAQKPEPVESKKRKRSSSKKNESAVVYMSRVPPGMDVGALRALLSRTGTLGRVWLRPEDSSAVSARRKLGGRRRGGFSDGWVEYTRRRDARNSVELLNGRPMAGAKRGGRWKNDLWCLKLLQKGFSWEDLVEETCGSKRERVLKVKAAVAASRREKAFVEERAELAKRIAMKEGRLEAEDADEDGKSVKKLDKRIVRRFKQKETFEEMEYEDDVDERRAREAARRLEEGEMEGATKKAKVDAELVQMLFGKKRSKAKSSAASD